MADVIVASAIIILVVVSLKQIIKKKGKTCSGCSECSKSEFCANCANDKQKENK